MVRRFWDIWGFLPREVVAFSRRTPPAWFLMSSGGEVMMVKTLLKRLHAETKPTLLSTASYDAFDLLRRMVGQERLFFPPWDTFLPAKRVLRQIRPHTLIFVQNACSPVLLRQARRAGVKTILINALLSRNVSVANKTMRRAIALGFHRELDWIAVQGEADLQAFLELGVPRERLEVTGDLCADVKHLSLGSEERSQLRQSLRLDASVPVMIAGSTHPGEGKMLFDSFRLLRQRRPQVRLILAPRWLHEVPEMAKHFMERGLRVMRRTELPDGLNGHETYDVLLLDTFGELGRLYGIADVVYIGSSLVPINERRGGHNILEPLAHGVTPLFGPHMNLWRDITDRMLSVWPGLCVDSAEMLAERAEEVLSGTAPVSAIREFSAKMIERGDGAVDRTLSFLRDRAGVT